MNREMLFCRVIVLDANHQVVTQYPVHVQTHRAKLLASKFPAWKSSADDIIIGTFTNREGEVITAIVFLLDHPAREITLRCKGIIHGIEAALAYIERKKE